MSVSSALKKIVPVGVRRTIIGPVRARLHWSLAFRRWQKLRKPHVKGRPATIRKIILVPTDFHGIVGSLGDDAMITATLHHLNETFDRPEIRVLTSTSGGDAVVRSLGLSPISGWNELDFVKFVTSVLVRHKPDAVVVVGADVIDGHYDGVDAAKALIFADLASRTGAHVTVLGFSFNARPAKEVVAVLNGIDEGVALNVRDPVSLERFQRMSSARGRLVADVAFLLPPTEGEREIVSAVQWINRERATGRTVLGLNVHPMLFKPGQDEGIERLLACVENMAASLVSRNISWLLVPHDYREDVGDLQALDTLMQRMEGRAEGHVLLLRGAHRASELKGLASRLDGVVTGRMHFAIAALGSGVPVLTITYQDKFEGLLSLIGLQSWLGIPANQALQDGVLAGAVERFVSDLENLKVTVGAAKESISSMSMKNFSRIGK